MIVGHPVGGDYDVGTRLLARYLPKYIPGNPAVIVREHADSGEYRGDQCGSITSNRRTAPVASWIILAECADAGGAFGQSNHKARTSAQVQLDRGDVSLPSRVCTSWFTSSV